MGTTIQILDNNLSNLSPFWLGFASAVCIIIVLISFKWFLIVKHIFLAKVDAAITNHFRNSKKDEEEFRDLLTFPPAVILFIVFLLTVVVMLVFQLSDNVSLYISFAFWTSFAYSSWVFAYLAHYWHIASVINKKRRKLND